MSKPSNTFKPRSASYRPFWGGGVRDCVTSEPVGVIPDGMEQNQFDFEPKKPAVPPAGNRVQTYEEAQAKVDGLQNAAFKDRREQLEGLIDGHLQQLTADLAAGKSDTLVAYLKMMSKFHQYSFGNQILIALQAPDATHVAGFQAWRKHGRFVKKGEKGICIMAPVTRVVGTIEDKQPDGSTQKRPYRRIVNIKGVFVFDVSQTDGEPLAEFAKVKGDPADHLARLEKLYAKQGVALEYVPFIGGGALGMSSGKTVQVLASLDPAHRFQVGVHELAHELLHKDEERRKTTTKTIRETEAEAVAFVVSSAVGLYCSTASSDYLQLYGGKRETLEGSLLAIRSAAKLILDSILPKPDNAPPPDQEDD